MLLACQCNFYRLWLKWYVIKDPRSWSPSHKSLIRRVCTLGGGVHRITDRLQWTMAFSDSIQDFKGEFLVRDASNKVYSAKWDFTPTKPTKREVGVSGWAQCGGHATRLHICSHSPCWARHHESKYGHVPPPIHVSLVGPAPEITVESSVVTEPAPAEAGGAPSAPLQDSFVDPAPLAADASEETPAVAGPADLSADVSLAGPFIPPSVEEALPAPLAVPLPSDKSEIAPSPPPAPLPVGVGVNVPPPTRATLLPIPSAKPCPLGEPGEASAKYTFKTPAVAGQEDQDGEAVLVVSELSDPAVAGQMNKLIVDLASKQSYVGVSAFLIFALRYRLRVKVWYALECEDLLSSYAPWANTAIKHCASVQAISCRILGDGSLTFHGDGLHMMNHWVVSVPLASGHMDSLGEGDSDSTVTFHATYLSLCLHVSETVADGDCGLDVMCLMLAWKRSKENRIKLRTGLADFAVQNLDNRAFVAMLHTVGELKVHLGFFELESSGADLLARPLPAMVMASSVEAARHGDGVVALGNTPPPLQSERHFSDEELVPSPGNVACRKHLLR